LWIAQQAVVRLEQPIVARIGDDPRAPGEGEDGDVLVAEARFGDGLADHVGALAHQQLGDPVSGADGEPLADVEFGEVDLVGDVVDDGAGDVEAGRRFDPLQAG
jgi:hypothetical protein